MNPTEIPSFLHFLKDADIDTDAFRETMLVYLLHLNKRIEGTDLLRDDPLKYIAEKDYYNEILAFAKHVISDIELESFGLI